MRTTLTIDDTLAAALRKKAFETGKSFKAVVNETLERGLVDTPHRAPARKPYKMKTFPLGKELVDLTHATRLVGEWEDEELIRKMELRK